MTLPPKPTKAEHAQAAQATEEARVAVDAAWNALNQARAALKAAEEEEVRAKAAMFTAQRAEDRVKSTTYLHTLPTELVEVLARAARREVLTLSDAEWSPFIRRQLVTRRRHYPYGQTWTADGSTLIAILRDWMDQVAGTELP